MVPVLAVVACSSFGSEATSAPAPPPDAGSDAPPAIVGTPVEEGCVALDGPSAPFGWAPTTTPGGQVLFAQADGDTKVMAASVSTPGADAFLSLPIATLPQPFHLEVTAKLDDPAIQPDGGASPFASLLRATCDAPSASADVLVDATGIAIGVEPPTVDEGYRRVGSYFGQWHKLALDVDGSTAYLAVDGAAAGSIGFGARLGGATGCKVEVGVRASADLAQPVSARFARVCVR